MPNSPKSLPKLASAALISIHPGYATKILSGEKRLEFRRNWTMTRVDHLIIYATSPVQRIVAVAQLGRIVRGSRTSLWKLARDEGGGISRRKLFAYLEGKKQGIALELLDKLRVADGLDPWSVFGTEFHPPQSFRFMKEHELEVLGELIEGATWE